MATRKNNEPRAPEGTELATGTHVHVEGEPCDDPTGVKICNWPPEMKVTPTGPVNVNVPDGVKITTPEPIKVTVPGPIQVAH
ncbi:MAG TPA: hypothetical protein VEU30_03860, partial [Thermoanaerobaculia bacterium]|nr:hypothetical protein [Thermoanaerobaculia bacterium]